LNSIKHSLIVVVAVNRFDGNIDVDANLIKLKSNQIEKLDQRQQPAKWTQLLRAGLITRGSIDFSGFGAIFTKPFTNAAFPGNVFASFTIWVPPVIAVMVWPNRCYSRIPKWFLFFKIFLTQDRGMKPFIF